MGSDAAGTQQSNCGPKRGSAAAAVATDAVCRRPALRIIWRTLGLPLVLLRLTDIRSESSCIPASHVNV